MAGPRPQKLTSIFNSCVRSLFPTTAATSGNRGAYALRRIEGDVAHFLMVTLWESEDAVRAFAGDDITVAKYYDFDKNFLLEMEPASTHYETFDH